MLVTCWEFNAFLPVGNNTDLLNFTHFGRGISSQVLYSDNRMIKPLNNEFVYNFKNKPILVSFGILDIQENFMIDRLKTRLEIDKVYTVFVKVRYNLDNFFMAGTQFGFVYTDYNELSLIYRNVAIRLEEYMESYDLVQDDISYIELSFREKDKVLLSDISIDKNITHIENKVIDTDKKLLTIPVSIDNIH